MEEGELGVVAVDNMEGKVVALEAQGSRSVYVSPTEVTPLC
jgi:hypothetical protein